MSMLREARTYAVPMRDGVNLATDVYLPEPLESGRQHRAPVLLSRTPYGRRGQVSCLPAIAEEMNALGYALVAQDVRGRYDSEGEAAPFADHELRDAYDTLDWIRSQPWAQDGVVMVGDSYCGWLQWAAVAANHPSLRAIVPGMTATGIGDTWMHDANAFCLRPMIEWAITAWSTRENRFVDVDWSTRPLVQLVSSWLGDTPAATAFESWTKSPPDSQYWQDGVFAAVRPTRIRMPALHVGGWWDLFRGGQLSDWRSARRRRSDQFLVMSASDHHHLPLLSEPWLGKHDEDDAQLARRYARIVAPFLEGVFGQADGSGIPPVRYEIAHDGWHEATTWPPEGVRQHSMSLVDASRATVDYHGGGLSELRPRDRSRLAWVHDPANLVPAPEPDPFALLVRAADQRVIEGRTDVPTFSSMPVAEPLDLVGQCQVALRGPSVRPGNQFVARLCDVFPDGRTFTITEGAVTLPSRATVGAADLIMQPSAYRIQTQHSLRLELMASSFPRYLPGGSDPWHSIGEPTEYELDIGGSNGTLLQLSVASS